MSDGLVDTNIPLKIIKRDGEATKRHRLTLDWYKEAFRHATPAGQIAMELALNLLLRNKDIRNFKFDDLNIEDNYYYKILSKTKSHGKESFIRIPANLKLIHSELGCETLDGLINYSKKLRRETPRRNGKTIGYPTPYVLHHEPKSKRLSKEKNHWTQLSKAQTSASFTDALKKAGCCSHLTDEERPTLHECISLGEHLYQEAGYSLEWIKELRGHQDISMTKEYLDGHEWTTISPSQPS